jgi:hypothetical protein
MDKAGVIESFPSGVESNTSGEIRQRRRQTKWWQFGGKDVSYVSVDEGLEKKSETESESDASSLVKNVNNVYESPEAINIYKPVEGFEGTHRFDPSAEWSPQEEKVLVRRVCCCGFAPIDPEGCIGPTCMC